MVAKRRHWALGIEGGDSDEGGEEGNLAFTSERKGIGAEGAVHDPLNLFHNKDENIKVII